MKQLSLLLGALCALSLPSAEALQVLINDTPYDVKALVKIDRLKDLQTPRRYHYSLNDRKEELILSQPIENPEIPDERPYAERKPFKAAAKKCWKALNRVNLMLNVVSGCGNILKFFGVF